MNYSEIGQGVSDKKIFLAFYINTGKINATPWQPCFLTNHNLNNLGRGSPKEHFYQVILKLVQWLLTRKFFQIFNIHLLKGIFFF